MISGNVFIVNDLNRDIWTIWFVTCFIFKLTSNQTIFTYSVSWTMFLLVFRCKAREGRADWSARDWAAAPPCPSSTPWTCCVSGCYWRSRVAACVSPRRRSIPTVSGSWASASGLWTPSRTMCMTSELLILLLTLAVPLIHTVSYNFNL